MRTWRPEPCSVSVALDIPCLVKCEVLLTTLDAWKYVGAPVSECLQPEENGVLIFILKIHLPFFNLSKSMEGALCLWLPFLSNKVAKALSRRSKHKHVGELTSVYGEAWACWWWYIHIVSIVLYIIYIYIFMDIIISILPEFTVLLYYGCYKGLWSICFFMVPPISSQSDLGWGWELLLQHFTSQWKLQCKVVLG